MRNQIVNIYGDSIMRGTVIDSGHRYHSTMPGLLKWLGELSGLRFRNRAHFGITIEKGKQVLEKDLQSGVDCGYAVLSFGGNDCSFAWEEIAADPMREHLPFTDIATFKATCVEMIGQLEKRGIRPILATLPPLIAERHLTFVGKSEEGCRNILHWLGDVNMIYRFHEMYSNAVVQIAEKTNTILVDVRNRFLEKRNLTELVGLDGVHLSPEGYRLYVQIFADFVEGKKKTPSQMVFA